MTGMNAGKGPDRDPEKACVIYRDTVSGSFVRRINRFTAVVFAEGQEQTVHVKNTGRLAELLVPGAKVTLQKADTSPGRAGAPARKTAYDLIFVYKDGSGWVNIDSLVPNKLVKQHLLSLDYDLVRPEFTYGDSRFDFYMERGGERYLMEVKGCTLAADPALFGQGTGLFPDAPTERGVKHLKELAAAAGKGYHCLAAFVIQMNGVYRVLPNDMTQPAFGQALSMAEKAGVEIVFYPCRVEADRICFI